MNPVVVMPLVEIIRGIATSDQVHQHTPCAASMMYLYAGCISAESTLAPLSCKRRDPVSSTVQR